MLVFLAIKSLLIWLWKGGEKVTENKSAKKKEGEGPSSAKAGKNAAVKIAGKKFSPGQSGLIRALENRGFKMGKEAPPYVLSLGGVSVEIRERDAAVVGTGIVVPLGKGAIQELEKALKRG